MKHEAPAWLADLQARFGGAIRTPLDRATGTLTAATHAYDEEIARETRAERLAVYNRQYWFRLFDVMHRAFPLTTRLFGAWAFNEHAARFLIARPPRSWDVDRVPDGFDAFLATTHPAGPHVEAARIDAAYRDVFRAPEVTPYRPTRDDAATLLDAQLVPSPAVAIVEEHSALVELRRAILDRPADARVDAPPSHDDVRSWVIVRGEEATATLPLERREAELLRLLADAPIRHALARLEATCTDEERATLPNQTRAWLARSVQLGLWISRR